MTRVSGAVVGGGPAWLLAMLLPTREDLEHRLDANDVGEPLRQATLEAHASLVAEGAAWAKRAATGGQPRPAADSTATTAVHGDTIDHVPTEYLTIQQAADLLSLSERTIRRHTTTGELPAVRIGRCVRIRRADLLKTTKTEAA